MNPQQPYPVQPPQAPQSPKKGTRPWLWLGAIAVALALLWGGCAVAMKGEGKTARTATTSRPTAVGVDATARATAASAPAVRCESAPDGSVAFLNAALSNKGYSLANAQQVTAANGDRYVGGDIMRGGVKASSADVWLLRADVPYALSSDARKLSGLADGRGLASAGDEWGSAVQECVVAAGRGK